MKRTKYCLRGYCKNRRRTGSARLVSQVNGEIQDNSEAKSEIQVSDSGVKDHFW